MAMRKSCPGVMEPSGGCGSGEGTGAGEGLGLGVGPVPPSHTSTRLEGVPTGARYIGHPGRESMMKG